MSTNPDDRSKTWCDFGWWRTSTGTRRLLSWNAATHELTLYGLTHWDPDMVVAVIDTEDEVRRRLEGWEAYNDTRGGLAWLAQRLEGCR